MIKVPMDAYDQIVNAFEFYGNDSPNDFQVDMIHHMTVSCPHVGCYARQGDWTRKDVKDYIYDIVKEICK